MTVCIPITHSNWTDLRSTFRNIFNLTISTAGLVKSNSNDDTNGQPQQSSNNDDDQLTQCQGGDTAWKRDCLLLHN